MNCKVENCNKPKHAKGYCATHYMKIRRTGTLESCKELGIEKMTESLKSELTKLDPTPDPKHRGYLAVNVVNDIKFKARQRGKDWQLTNVEAYKLIIGACHYCGYSPAWPTARVGIDRVDNNKGYTLDNCVSCCFTCNSAKGELSVEEFRTWLRNVYERMP